ncbi:MAG: radical SAM protein, partial [Phycisphaerae bacterium]
YCYARTSHEYLGFGAGTDFETRIVVKTNAPKLLARRFASRGWRGELVNFSGVTDCYQPIEAVYELTRRCLETCLEWSNPASVVTKSYLVVRDADLLAEIQSRCGGRTFISIPFADDETARKIEPHAPPPSRRFDAIERLAAAGVPVGVMVAPIIPGLNDRDVPAVLQRAADCGAKAAGYMALRLPGNVEPVFLSRLRNELPLRADRVVNRIREIRGGRMDETRFGKRMRGEGAYWDSVRQLFELSRKRYGLDTARDETAAPPRSVATQPADADQAVQLPLFPA